MRNQQSAARARLISAMAIFGTIGIFVRYIALPSSFIAFVRGLLGALFLLILLRCKKQPLQWRTIWKKLPALCLTGGLIGINWVLLFEAYRYTKVSTATLCYYLAPTFVILGAALFCSEKLTWKSILCVLAALIGMGFVSGVFQGELPAQSEWLGILLGVGAAVLYACVVLMNKVMGMLPAYEKTTIQLGSAAIVVLPYLLLTENLSALELHWNNGILLLIVAIIHTGFAYSLYFGAIDALPARTSAIFSYIDPVVSLLLSALLLGEKLSLLNLVGAVMILGAAIISELPSRKS